MNISNDCNRIDGLMLEEDCLAYHLPVTVMFVYVTSAHCYENRVSSLEWFVLMERTQATILSINFDRMMSK